MTDNPSVSVIVPMYKVEQYIKTCVDSILAQTFQDFEIILVDDASPDNCVDICQKFYGTDARVKLVRHEKNLGLGPARNTGMAHARGKYIYFVDSDDYLVSDALEKFFDAAEKNDAEVVHAAGSQNIVQTADDPDGTMNLVWDRYAEEGFLPDNVPDRLERHWRNGDTRSNAWLCFCRRDFLQRHKIEFLPIISEDEPFNFALLCLAKRYYILHAAPYVHLLREGSIMRSHDTKRLRQGIDAMVIAAPYIEKFLDDVPRFDDYDSWREKIIDGLFGRFMRNHTEIFFTAPTVPSETVAAVDETLEKNFGDGSSFVKYFFNGYRRAQQKNNSLAAQSRQFRNIATTFFREQPALAEMMTALKSDGKKIFLLGTPQHGNLGDHAIALGELHVLKKFFPDREVIEIPVDYLSGNFGQTFCNLLAQYVRREDFFALIGGGNLGNLWLNNERARRLAIANFPRNKIIVFPQSICFTNTADGHRELAVSRKIYNAHRDLHIMTRDEVSFSMAKKFFPAAKSYLLPDVVTVLQGIVDDVDVRRNGVLFVLRRDKEKVRDDKKIFALQKFLTAKKIPYAVVDTNSGEKILPADREQKVRDLLIKFRRSKLVITDRFHGMVFAFITRTPALVFKSLDTKISSGARWFRNLPTIFYAEGQDQPSIENFVEHYCSVTEEKNFSALTLKTDTDADERFTRTLNQIFAAKSNRMTINAVNISAHRIAIKCNVQGSWQKFFNPASPFYTEYSADVSRTPKSVAVIPFLCNVLPLAWVLNAEIVVPELDSDFYAHVAEIKRGYVKMYPRIKFGGKLTVGKLIAHDAVGDETAAFFSGGVDSFDTLIAHADEHPTLITIRGADVKLSDVEGWQRVQQHALDTAKNFGCKNLFIKSTFREFLREDVLSRAVMKLAGDGWWHGFQHGIGIIGQAAPYAYLHKLKTLYIASSFCAEHTGYTCASDPTIDNHVHIGRCVTVHDGFDFNRQTKLRRICEFRRRTGTAINLRVCWKVDGGENCCACEKCYRTICGLLAEGENPVDYGFTSYTDDMPEKIREDFQRPDFRYRPLNWQMIQSRFRERPENLPDNLTWLMELGVRS